MGNSSQYGLTYERNDKNLFLPFWNNPNGPTWTKRMLPNGGNKNQGNIDNNGKRWWASRLSKLF